MKDNIIEDLMGKIVVSCQALPEEPLHSSFIMGRMAVAAKEGGADGIRANSIDDIKEIKGKVNIPIIGIIKCDYKDSEVFITPTKKELNDLINVGVDIIAMDATSNKRPNGETLREQVNFVKEASPDTSLMADISTTEEAYLAEKLGFDCISTTLVGYTKKTQGHSIVDDDFRLLSDLLNMSRLPIVAEGKISSPSLAKRALEKGAAFVVVGSAITRPQVLTRLFVNKLSED